MANPKESHTKQYCCINGSDRNLLDRLAVSELCKGWPSYRDNSEWMNYRSLFTDDAYVWTTWSGARSIDDFIEISKTGKANGVSIQHRENGTSVELNPQTGRAVGKMKATITQRFIEDIRLQRSDAAAPAAAADNPPAKTATTTTKLADYDVDCDCRFLFFCLRSPDHGGDWKVKYVKLIYEKDKIVPVDGKTLPNIGEREELEDWPEGYRYLGAAQESLGYDVDCHLVTLEAGLWERMYRCMERWLDGEENPGLFWDKEGRELEVPKGAGGKAGQLSPGRSMCTE